LRHIERNSTLLFLVPVDAENIKAEYDILVNELTKYNPEMLDKERMLVISKCDMLDEDLKKELKVQLDKEFINIPYMLISSVAQQGLMELKDKLWEMLNQEQD
jgi:GTP-binding protein